jgi:hypothetical protein
VALPDRTTRHPSTADRIAYAFYGAAATAALVGQVWAAVQHIPWPQDLPVWARIVMVTPAVGVIELGGVATSALADSRRRLGESALAYRAMSAAAAIVAVAFNLLGHAAQPYLAFGFAGLSAFAYALWLAHSGARRRDALRASGHMARTAPVYGPLQWLREPGLTRLARSLALERNLGLHESLAAAREEVRTATRRKAIAGVVEQIIRADHTDPLHAQVAASTYDMDRLATEIEARADYTGWAHRISRSLSPGPIDPAEQIDRPDPVVSDSVTVSAVRLPSDRPDSDQTPPALPAPMSDLPTEPVSGPTVAQTAAPSLPDRLPDTDGPAEQTAPDPALAADIEALQAMSNKREAIRYAFAQVGSEDVPRAVAWLDDRGVTVTRSEAYTVRIQEQKDAQRKITLIPRR